MDTDKVIRFSGGIGEIGSVPGFQTTNTAGSANTDFGIRATTIRFATGSSEKVRVAAAGHLEFNPVNSFAALNNSILSSSNTYMYMMGGAAGLYLADNANLSNSIGIRNADFIDFNTGGTGEKMRINSSGNVGIGQTDPASTLHIGDGASHYVRIENAGSGDVSSGYQIYRGSSIGMSLYDNPQDNTTSLLCAGSLNINAGGSGADLHVNTGGNVGIGTTDPNAPLEISGGTAMAGGWGRSMVLRHNFPTLVWQSEYSTDAYAGIGYDNSTGMHFMVNSPTIDVFASSQQPALFIRDDKRVGIGTTSPTAKLEISGKDDAEGATDLLALQFDNSPADTGMTFTDIFGGVKSRLTIDSSNTNDLRISSATQMHFYGGTTNGTGDGHLKIHSGGQVTTPTNPAFRAYLSTERTTNGEITSGWNDNTTAGSRAYDINGNFNISNGRFTAPVAGVYVFSIMWDSLTSHGGLQVFLNGAVYNTMWEPTGFSNAAWESRYHGTHMKLAVNDYVTLVVVHASGSNPVHMGSGVWGHFAGCLVG